MTDELVNSANSGQPETAPDKSGETPKLFSQTEVDRIIGERLKRAEDSVLKRFLGELGLETPDALKELVKAQKDAAEAKKSELQRWEEQKTALAAERDTYKAELEKLTAARRRDKRTAVLSNALREAKATDVDDLMVLVEAKYGAEMEALSTDGETVDTKAVAALLETVRKNHARFFVASTPGSPSNAAGGKPVDTSAERVSAILGGRKLINF